MGNWKLTAVDQPRALTREVLRQLRFGRLAGLSRRQLIRRSIGATVGLWALELTGARSPSSGSTCRAASAVRSSSVPITWEPPPGMRRGRIVVEAA